MPKQQSGWANLESDAVNASAPRRTGCGIARLIEKQPAPARKAIEAALANPDVTANGFRAALSSKGVPDEDIPRAATIQRHRKGECGCGKKAA